MPKIFVHAAAATAGGGLTYIKNVVPRLATFGRGYEWHVLMSPKVIDLFSDTPGVYLRPAPANLGSALHRIYYDQVALRREIGHERFDLILATGNFGLINPPVPQILFSRNPLYFSEHHCRELRRRRLYAEWVDIRLKRMLALASIRSSAVNISPTAAFQNHIERFGQVDRSTFRPVHHGFDHQRFHEQSRPLSEELRQLLQLDQPIRRVLFVSHYNYFRNFESVLRAVPELKRRCGQQVKLVLTTHLGEGVKEHRYDTTEAARLMKSLGIEQDVIMLGHVPYENLAGVYRACDLAVCPSYAETFGHPMVEAMSCGLPVVATDMDIHREICQDAGLYFSVFDPADLAAKIATVLQDAAMHDRLSRAALQRSRHFSWDDHVRQVLGLVDEVLAARCSNPAMANVQEAAK